MSKLKLLLLGGILTLFGIFNFSKADVIVNYDGNGGFVPDKVYASQSFNPISIDLYCPDIGEEYSCFFSITNTISDRFVNYDYNYMCDRMPDPETMEETCNLMFSSNIMCYVDGEIIEDYSQCFLPAGEYNLYLDGFQGGFTIPGVSATPGGDTGGGDTGGGDTGGGDTGGGNVIINGFQALNPAFNGLHSTIIQLLPLVIYLGIGILLFTLGFFAIRWLVNWLGGKINSNFSSKRD